MRMGHAPNPSDWMWMSSKSIMPFSFSSSIFGIISSVWAPKAFARSPQQSDQARLGTYFVLQPAKCCTITRSNNFGLPPKHLNQETVVSGYTLPEFLAVRSLSEVHTISVHQCPFGHPPNCPPPLGCRRSLNQAPIIHLHSIGWTTMGAPKSMGETPPSS